MGYEEDTAIGGGQGRFPNTRLTVLDAVRGGDGAARSAALESIIDVYWKPVYKYVRIQWRKSNEDAKDLTQGFFAVALEKNYMAGYDPTKGAFRTFLRTCVDAYVSKDAQTRSRLKRGGGWQTVPLDFESAEAEIAHSPATHGEAMEDYFHREWLRRLFTLAVADLQAHAAATGRQTRFRLFADYDLNEGKDESGYDALAERYDLKVTDVTNHLAWARREFRRLLLERLRSITGGEREFRDEAAVLLGWRR